MVNKQDLGDEVEEESKKRQKQSLAFLASMWFLKEEGERERKKEGDNN